MNDPVTPSWTNEEVFAAGVLHDMPIAILSSVAPPAYDQVHALCKEQGVTFDQAFYEVFEGSVRELGKQVVRVWGLPEVFALSTEFVNEPWRAPKDNIPLMAINYASAVADSNLEISNGVGVAPWGCPVTIAPEVQEAVGLPEEERDTAFTAILGQLEQYVPAEIVAGPHAAGGNRPSSALHTDVPPKSEALVARTRLAPGP